MFQGIPTVRIDHLIDLTRFARGLSDVARTKGKGSSPAEKLNLHRPTADLAALTFVCERVSK